MFDVGFWEMAFIGVIALVVIGPERLPGVARSVGLWVGKGRRMLNEVMSDVKKEMKEYDLEQVKTLRDDLKSASTSASKELKDMTQSAADSLGLKAVGNEFKKSIDDVADSASDSLRQETSKINQGKRKASPDKSVASKKTAGETTAKKKPITRKKTATRKAANKTTTKPATTRSSRSHAKRGKSTNEANQMTDDTPYYIYENSLHKYAMIHKATCSFCNNGRGMHGIGAHGRERDEWHGPFNTLAAAKQRQKTMRVKTKRECGSCINRTLL